MEKDAIYTVPGETKAGGDLMLTFLLQPQALLFPFTPILEWMLPLRRLPPVLFRRLPPVLSWPPLSHRLKVLHQQSLHFLLKHLLINDTPKVFWQSKEQIECNWWFFCILLVVCFTNNKRFLFNFGCCFLLSFGN